MCFSTFSIYHLKTTAFSYSRSPSIRILKKAKTKSSIFKFWDWRNLFSYSLPSLYSEKKLEEPKRPPKSMDTLSWKQEKNDPIWQANTHAHTLTHTLIQLWWIIPLVVFLLFLISSHLISSHLSLFINVYTHNVFIFIYLSVVVKVTLLQRQ